MAGPVTALSMIVLIPEGNPKGLAIPYISGRLGPVSPTTAPPTGTVFPDDFCLPGKFEDCGEHLRDAGDFSPSPQNTSIFDEGPVFVGRENPAFSRSELRFWANGQSRQTEMSAASESINTTSTSIGGDRRFGSTFILGAMALRENTTTTFALPGSTETATGTKYGPYFALRLSDTWVLDGRYLVGRSSHQVNTGGFATGQFNSQGGFGALRVSAALDRGNWRIHPSLELSQEFQNSDAYTDTFAGAVAASSESNGFITGAVLAYYSGLGAGNGNLLPYAGLELSQSLDGGGTPFGAVRAGMAITMGNGAVLNFDYAYGAIGLANINDQLLSIRLEIPF